MFLLFGLITRPRELPGRTATCQHCGQFVHHHLEERTTKLTLFFVPVLTTSRKLTTVCSNCGYISTGKAPRNSRPLTPGQ
ncbi:zinc-ribbon domain-containing protein [Arthrobacter sp. SIMBA_036]|uniref:zinc-ribbon domain-containing protein n=1 Tax=Arthrobacter sp. SIMBA_036 TaxID=3085778 RepID=UPI0039780406